MLISEQHKILYVAVPKTATTSIQEWLRTEDSSFIDPKAAFGRSINLWDHSTAFQAQQKLGKDYYDSLEVIAFLRHPIFRIISSYNFYRMGAKRHSLFYWHPNASFLRYVISTAQILSAQILPIRLWALLHPYMDNKRYFTDNNGNIIVDHIGRYESLADDLKCISEKLELDVDISKLPNLNVSKTSDQEFKLNHPTFIKMLKIRHTRFKEDLIFYNAIISQLNIKSNK